MQGHTLQDKPKKNKIVRMGGSSVLNNYRMYRFLFVLITRTFYMWQNIQKQSFSNFFSGKNSNFFKCGIKNLLFVVIEKASDYNFHKKHLNKFNFHLFLYPFL